MTRRVVLPVVKSDFRNVYADLAAMEALLQSSHIDWTVVRPPRLVDKPVAGRYRAALGANVVRGSAISRPDVAHAMLEALPAPQTFRHAVGVAY